MQHVEDQVSNYHTQQMPQKYNARQYSRPRIKRAKLPRKSIDDTSSNDGERHAIPTSTDNPDYGIPTHINSLDIGAFTTNLTNMVRSIIHEEFSSVKEYITTIRNQTRSIPAMQRGIRRIRQSQVKESARTTVNEQLTHTINDLKQTNEHIQRARDQEEAKRAKITTEKRAADSRAAESEHRLEIAERLLAKEELHNKQLGAISEIRDSVDNVASACGLRVSFAIDEDDEVRDYHLFIEYECH